MNRKLYLLGHAGYVGSWIDRYFREKGYDIQTIRTDVTDLEQVRKDLKDVRDSVVINATGKTGTPNVDWCEDHRLETASVNITGAINVSQVASEQGNYVVQIGSGCIFSTPEPLGLSDSPLKGGEHLDKLKDKRKIQVSSLKDKGIKEQKNIQNSKFDLPARSRSTASAKAGIRNSESIYAFTEEDEPNFFGSFYSQTKAVAEGALKEIPNVCVLRIRMPLQGSPHPKNLLDKLLRYDRILSVPNSVTIMEDFMPFLERVLEKRPEGILNAVNPGVYEHRDLLSLYTEIVDPRKSFSYLSLEEFKGMTKAERSNCVLSTALTESMGIAMPDVVVSLPRLMERYSRSIKEGKNRGRKDLLRDKMKN